MSRAWFVAACLLAAAPSARAQRPPALKPGSRPIEVKVPSRKVPVSYAGEVVEFLEDKCVGCHGSVLAENRLSLEGVPAMLKGGKRGPALVPGKADESLLFKMAAHRVEPVMPPKDKPGNSPLSPEQLGLLKLWIEAGAKDDTTENAGAEKPKQPKSVVLGELPPGVQPINAVDLTANGARVAAGRANVVQVYDVDSGLEIVSLGGHKDLIQSVRFSPDGTMLAAGSYQIASLWTVPTGAEAKTLSGHGGPVHAVAIAPDGKRAYSGSQDGTLRAWELDSGKVLWTLGQPAPVTALAILPDGKTLVGGGGDGVIRLIDVADRREHAVLKGHTAAVEGLAPAPCEGPAIEIVSVSADGTGRIWGVTEPPVRSKDGKTAHGPARVKSVVLRGHKGPVRAVTVASAASGSADARFVLTAGDDATVRRWSPRDGSPRGTLKTGHTGPILALAASPDGKSLLTGSADTTARLVAIVSAGEGDGPARVLGGHPGAVNSVAFSPGGDRVATAGAEGGLKVWEAASGRGVIAFGHTPASGGGGALPDVRKVAFTAAGGILSASADGTLKTWRFSGAWSRRGDLAPHAFRVLALDFSPDGKLLATGGGEPSRSGEIKVWEVATGRLVRSLDSLHSDTVFALRFSPDGTRLASGAADRFLKVTRVSDGKELRSFEGHTHHVMAVDWNADGKQIITGGADKVLKLWDFDSGEQVRTLQEAGKQITSARWIAGKPEVVAASGDSQVRTWNPDSGAVVRGFGGPGDYVFSVAASADGTRIAAGGADSVLFLWNGQNGKVLRKLAPPPARPASGPGQSPRTASAR